MSNSERYVLVEVEPGGLLLDCHSGVTLQVNAAALFAWRLHLAGRPLEAIVAAFAAHFQVSAETGRRDVSASLDGFRSTGPAAPPTEFHYQRTTDGYIFSRSGEPLFLVDDRGTTLAPLRSPRLTVEEARNFLFGFSPKLLSLRGQTVLHASAVELDGRAIAFSGQSGAGKTTTARALVRAGATLIAEDKLLIEYGAAGVRALSASEDKLRQWVNAAAVELAAGRNISCDALDAVTSGPATPFTEIGFLGAERRTSRGVECRRLSSLDAAGAIFNNSFQGSDVPSDWARQLETSATIARVIGAYELTMPDGLSALADAVTPVVARRSLRSR
jgi:hypothetical protein